MALAGGAATGLLLVLAAERVIATALGVAGGGLPVAAGATPVLALVAPTGPCRGSSAPATSLSDSGSGWRSRAGCFASTARSCRTNRRRRSTRWRSRRCTNASCRSPPGAPPSSSPTASARLADRILVLDGGRIVEDGTHEQLLAGRGLYHRMFTSQAAWHRRS